MDATLTPLDKGAYSQTYSVRGKNDGYILSNGQTYSRIVSTDYTTYILEYYCQQRALDLYTKDYFAIYTPTGTITDSLLTTVKEIITANYASYDVSQLKAAQTSNCYL